LFILYSDSQEIGARLYAWVRNGPPVYTEDYFNEEVYAEYAGENSLNEFRLSLCPEGPSSILPQITNCDTNLCEDITTLYIYVACQTEVLGIPYYLLANSYPVPLSNTNPDTSMIHFKKINDIGYYMAPFALMGAAQISLGSHNFVGLCQTTETCLSMWFPHPASPQFFFPNFMNYVHWLDESTLNFIGDIDTSPLYLNLII
jgi:hypothetical protein